MGFKIPHNFQEIFQSDDGATSCKRVLAVLCGTCLIIGFFANMFYRLQIDHYIYDTLKQMFLGTTGLTALEKFVPNPNKPPAPPAPPAGK